MSVEMSIVSAGNQANNSVIIKAMQAQRLAGINGVSYG